VPTRLFAIAFIIILGSSLASAQEIAIENKICYLDLGKDIIAVGQEQEHRLYKYDADKDRMLTMAASPDGKKTAFLTVSKSVARIQIRTSGIKSLNYLFELGADSLFHQYQPFAWSADSQSVSLSAQTTAKKGKVFIIHSPFEEMKAIETNVFWQNPVLSPEGRRIAYTIGCQKAITGPPQGCRVGYTDLEEKTDYLLGDLGTRVLAWQDSKLLIYKPAVVDKVEPPAKVDVVSDSDGRQSDKNLIQELVCYNLEDKSEVRVSIFWHDFRQLSPDKRFVFRTTRGVAISPADKENFISVLNDESFAPLYWEPKMEFLLIFTPKDQSLWLFSLATKEREKVAGNIDRDQIMETLMAQIGGNRTLFYVTQGRFISRSITVIHGAEAQKIREQKDKELQEEAKIYANTIKGLLNLYFQENGQWPPDDSNQEAVIKVLESKLEGRNVLYRPDDPKKIAFHYLAPRRQIQNTQELKSLCLGWLDWGKGWKLYIYADNHHEIVEDH
jgi:hypothetical protein